MPTIQDAKTDVYNSLVGLGYNPSNLIISELITDTGDESWKMNGEFKGGFLGEIFKFVVKYNSESRGIVNIKVTPDTTQEGYA